MILVRLAEGTAHEYSAAITPEVKHIVLFACVFIFLTKIYIGISRVFFVLLYMSGVCISRRYDVEMFFNVNASAEYLSHLLHSTKAQ